VGQSYRYACRDKGLRSVSAFVALQRLLPQHALSRVLGRVASSASSLISQPLIRAFCAAYDVDLADAERKSAKQYDSFNDFFTRALAPGLRPLPADPAALVSPADGTLSQVGTIEGGTLLQAKGVRYPLASLLLDSRAGKIFNGGWFATVYLAPSDYHRVHAPFGGMLVRSVAVPGELYSVNARTEAGVDRLFCRNERLVIHLRTDYGPLILVMVGALIVASIETVFDGPQSPYRKQQLITHQRPFERGQELGRFLLGSTVILLVPPGPFAPDRRLAPGYKVEMGRALGTFSSGQS
jgi:phosphatidylserine decarboxylase